MTGFGRAEQTVGDKTFQVDIKSLNGKQFELLLKLPGFLKPLEFDIRRILSGSIGSWQYRLCTLVSKKQVAPNPFQLILTLRKAYYKPLAELSEALKLDPSHILSTLVKLA